MILVMRMLVVLPVGWLVVVVSSLHIMVVLCSLGGR